MNKIHLDPDLLHVESFQTVAGRAGARGTVAAHSDDSANCPETAWKLYTCGISCDIYHCRHTLESPGCSD